MSELEYYLLNPTENITLLVTSPVADEIKVSVAKALFRAEKTAEQVGFLTDNGNKNMELCMSGGEFCGNAAMSAGVLYAIKNSLDNASVSVRFVNAETVKVSVQNNGDGSYTGCVDMPPPVNIKEAELTFGGKDYSFTVIDYGGITHIIYEGEMDKADAEKAVVKWCDDIGAKALGIMFLNKESRKLTPLVFVKESAALYWEGSCASGTAAVGEYLFLTDNSKTDFCFFEPKGNLTVKKCENILKLSGNVKLSAHKFTEV